MKIVRYYEYGEPEVLKLEEGEVPRPGAGEVLVKVEAIDLGYIDTQMRNGSASWGTPVFPIAPGAYVYGTVMVLGADVQDVREGEHILGFAPAGAYAEYALVPLALRYPLPDVQLTPAELVTLPIAGDVAYHVLNTSAQLRAGERVLIHAAAGGVSHFAIQIARAMGAGQIIATSSTAEKLEVARSVGADTLINYTDADWAEQVKKATDGKGVDVVLDMVGGQIMLDSLPLLAHFGRYILYGVASGKAPDISSEVLFSLMMNLIRIEGFSSLTLMQYHQDKIAEGRQGLWNYVKEGKIRPLIMKTFSLAEASEAHRLLESRASYGKIVLHP